jgi:zinc/manganese transport system substrate-binding protein
MRTVLLLFVFALGVARADTIKIVAAENFYGGVAAQIGGTEVQVTSILSNPNQDPHEFTTNAATAKAVADADIVIYNGLGYDAWMEKLLGTPGKKDRVVIRVADLIGAKDGDNPHIWYDPRTMPALAIKVLENVSSRIGSQGPDSGERHHLLLFNLETFTSSMTFLIAKIAAIKSEYRGTTVTATEPVFGYMAAALGLKMLNYDFQLNIMNDTEPSAAQTAAFEKSLTSKTVKVLFYNEQVTDPTTERLKKLALASGVPIVGVTETQPADQKTYAGWMLSGLKRVRAGLLPPGSQEDKSQVLPIPANP